LQKLAASLLNFWCVSPCNQKGQCHETASAGSAAIHEFSWREFHAADSAEAVIDSIAPFKFEEAAL
jgi:hypothetical protein